MILPAPCLFSTTTGWPSSSDNGWAMMRVTMSVPPPTPAPTMIWIGRAGHSGAATASAAAASSIVVRRVMAGLFFVFDRVAQDADALDLDLAGVAVAHPDRIGLARMADAGRRAGEDDVAGLEREALGEIDQHLAHRKHHVVGVVRLHDLAVEPAFDLQALAGLGQLVGGDHPGPEAAGAIEVLAHVPLRRLALEFAHRAFVGAGIAGDARGRIVHRQMFRGPADDQHQLGLVVERFGGAWPDDRALVRHHRGQAAHEDRREFRDVVALRAFLDVLEIVEPEADDLAGPAHRQRICETRERAMRRGGRALGKVLDGRQVALGRGEQRAEVGRDLGVSRLQIEHLVARHDAEVQTRRGLKTHDFHLGSLSSVSSGFYAGGSPPPWCDADLALRRRARQAGWGAGQRAAVSTWLAISARVPTQTSSRHITLRATASNAQAPDGRP